MKLKTFLTLGLWRDRPSPILTHRVRGWYEGKHRDAILDLPGGSAYGEATCYAGSKREAEEYEKLFSKAGFSTEVFPDMAGILWDGEVWELTHLYWCENCQVIVPRNYTRWAQGDAADAFFEVTNDRILGTMIKKAMDNTNFGDVRVHKHCGNPVAALSDMKPKEVEKYVRKHEEAA